MNAIMHQYAIQKIEKKRKRENRRRKYIGQILK